MSAPPCPPELWPEFSRLLDQALDLPEPERAGWLDRLAGEQAALRPWLQRVLLHPAGALTKDWLQAPRLPPAERAEDFVAGQRIGPYALLRELGRGGMGVVWLAQRIDGQLKRELALKLPHAHLLAGALRERFARERDILAALSHPHIAALHDAGLADGGQPYLALEHVEGEGITAWCQARAADLATRVSLMRQVMAAVQYAHARLVVHRDLKPSNVLVDAQGQAKLLDFGIAKLLGDDEGGAATALTQLGGRVATPDYAAPEQLAGEPVTTATDVYALAAMLYELLCGQRPFDRRAQGRLSLGESAPAEAPLASSRVGDEHAAQVGGLTAAALRRALRGDLDAILAKALSPRPEQRYASVEAFAADLGRAQRHEPIQARRIGRLQVAAKFLRRHRLGASFAAALLLVLAAGITGVLWQAREAQQQARRANAVKDFLIGVFKASDPRIASDKPRGQITARELLDISSGRIEQRFADDPEVQIELLRTAADIYRELGEDAAYEQLQERQLELVRQHYGPLHPNLLDGALERSSRACLRQDWPACARLQQEAEALLIRAGEGEGLRRANWLNTEIVRLRAESGSWPRRQRLHERALALLGKLGPGSVAHITALHEMANDLQAEGDHLRAIATTREALALAEKAPDRNDAELQTTWANLGITYQQIGDFLNAAEAFEKAAALAELTSGADHVNAIYPRAQAARTLHLAGERERAWTLFGSLRAALDSAAGGNDLASIREHYGERLAAEGRAVQGIPYLERAEREFASQSAYEFALRRVRRNLGDAYERAGRTAEARRALKAAYEEQVAKAAPEIQPTVAARERWGRFLLAQGEFDAAARQFQQVIDEAANKSWAHVALARGGLAAVALRRHDRSLALRHSAEALATWQSVVGFRDVRMGPYLQRIRADVLAADGQLDAAQALEDEAATASRRYDDPSSPTAQRRRLSGGGG